MKDRTKPVANPSVLLREEFDDWAVLFDPDTGHGFGLNPTGVYLWKLLDGGRSIDEMLHALRRDAPDVPEEAGEQILAFVEELAQHGLVVYDVEESHDGRERILPRTTGIAENLPDGGREAGQLRSGMLPYERPRLEPLTLEARAQGACATGNGCCTSGSDASSDYCHTGYSPGVNSTGYCCFNTGMSANGGSWACATGVNASGGALSSCGFGDSGGSCGSGGIAA